MPQKYCFLLRRNAEPRDRTRGRPNLKLTPTLHTPVVVMAKPFLETFTFDVRITGEAYTIANKYGLESVKQMAIDFCMDWYRENVDAFAR